MAQFDVVIVGGGIAGASLGAEIAARRSTLIVEAEDHCGYHSTGRSAAFWLESYGGPNVALLSAASRDPLYRPAPDLSGHGFLHTRGAVHLSDGDWPEVPDGVSAQHLSREELERMVPGIRPRWTRALLEPGCADIDVAGLHAAFLRRFRRDGGSIATRSRLLRAGRRDGGWAIALEDGSELRSSIIVDAAGAWADGVAEACGANRLDVATAIDRFEGVVDWPVERIERSWAGLRSFAPDRLPVYGFDADVPGFFWCAGQGGFGIQTAPAAAKLAASVLLGEAPDDAVAHIDPETFSPRRFSE